MARFKSMATNAIQKIRENGHIPVVVGGTGFYIQALLYDSTFEDDESDYEYRNYLQGIADTKGAEVLHDMLKEADPESAEAFMLIMSKELFVHLNFIRRQAERYQSIIMSRELKSHLIIFVTLFLMIKEKFYTTE